MFSGSWVPRINLNGYGFLDDSLLSKTDYEIIATNVFPLFGSP